MSQTCPQCQHAAGDEADHCPECGTSLRSVPDVPTETSPASASAEGPLEEAPVGAAPTTTSLPAYRFDPSRWSRADRISGVATFLLFVSLFFPWFTQSDGLHTQSVNGLWHEWMFITLIVCILIEAYLVLRAGWDELPINQGLSHFAVMTVATLVNALLALIAFFDKPAGPGIGWGFGAILGLVVALVAAAPFVVPPLRAKTA